jgi:ABC-type Fe3+-hydroxamate transport system substrate-binding protein
VKLRVVSLVPSVTETLRAWDRDPIACTRFCEQPDLTHVGGTKDPDIAAIVALGPDIVVVEEEENRIEDHDALVAAGVEVLALHVTGLDDVGPQMTRLSELLDVDWSPPVLGGSVAPRLKAFVPIWRRPFMTFNSATYGASLLAHLGVENVFGNHADTYPVVETGDIEAAEPQIVLAPSEPYPFTERHSGELGQFAPVEFVDGQDLFWWGARTEAAVERLRIQLGGMGPSWGGVGTR